MPPMLAMDLDDLNVNCVNFNETSVAKITFFQKSHCPSLKQVTLAQDNKYAKPPLNIATIFCA